MRMALGRAMHGVWKVYCSVRRRSRQPRNDDDDDIMIIVCFAPFDCVAGSPLTQRAARRHVLADAPNVMHFKIHLFFVRLLDGL